MNRDNDLRVFWSVCKDKKRVLSSLASETQFAIPWHLSSFLSVAERVFCASNPIGKLFDIALLDLSSSQLILRQIGTIYKLSGYISYWRFNLLQQTSLQGFSKTGPDFKKRAIPFSSHHSDDSFDFLGALQLGFRPQRRMPVALDSAWLRFNTISHRIKQ